MSGVRTLSGRRVMQMSGGPSADTPRSEDDFYPTPPEATYALLSVEDFPDIVWEPACGDGAISEVLKAHGHTVCSTDLRDRGYGGGGFDFFSFSSPKAAAIVTNPPFTLAREFIEHGLKIGVKKSAYLLRLQFLEGNARRKMFESTPLARVWVFSKRIPRMHNPEYTGKKTNSLIAFAWFVWDVTHSGPPQIGWVNPEPDPFA